MGGVGRASVVGAAASASGGGVVGAAMGGVGGGAVVGGAASAWGGGAASEQRGVQVCGWPPAQAGTVVGQVGAPQVMLPRPSSLMLLQSSSRPLQVSNWPG